MIDAMRAELTRTPADAAVDAAPSDLRVAAPFAAPVELRMESDAVSLAKGTSRLGVFALAFGLAAIATAVSPIFVLVALIPVYVYGRWRARAARACHAVIRVTPGEEGAMVLERRGKRIRFDLAKIADCWHSPEGHAVNVMVAWGRALVSIQVPDRDSAATLSKRWASTAAASSSARR